MLNRRVVTIRARAFSCEDSQENRCLVDADGTVRVWDEVAGYFTHCHILSEKDQRRARKRAAEQAPTPKE